MQVAMASRIQGRTAAPAFQIERAEDGRTLVRVTTAKLTYPMLASFFAAVLRVVQAQGARVVIDLGAVSFIDNASIGCLAHLARAAREQGGWVTLTLLQPTVARMLDGVGVLEYLRPAA